MPARRTPKQSQSLRVVFLFALLCRNPELVYLLDGQRFFPAGIFSRDEALLAALQQLGLRTAVTPDTLLESAHFVEQLSATNEDAAYAR